MTTRNSYNRNKIISWLLLTIIAIAFYVINILSAEYLDDFVYKFIFVNGEPDYSRSITRISDIVHSQIDHYYTWNGRTVVHFIVQLFTGILGKNIFNVFNTVVFITFVFLLKRNISRSNGFSLFEYPLVFFLVLMLPSPAATLFWMTGSINYLWSATGLVLFLALYDTLRKNTISKRLILMSFPLFLLGWTHEAIVLPIALSIIVLDAFHIKKSIRTTGFWMAVIFFAGACMSAFSPSTTARAGVGGLSANDVAIKVVSGFIVLSKLRIIYITIILATVLWFKNRSLLMSLVSNNRYLILASIPALGIVFVSGFESSRTAFGLELYCLLFLLRTVGQCMKTVNTHTALNRIGISLFVVVGLFYGLVIYHAIPTWHETQDLISQIQKNDDGVIATNEHDAGFFSSYIRTMIEKDDSEYAMNYDPHCKWSASMAATYHRDSLIFLPQQFIKELSLNPNRFDEFDMNSPYEFFIKKIDNEHIVSVLWQLRPTDFSTMPFFFAPIAKRMGRYADNVRECDNWTIIYLKGKRYLIVKKTHAWDKRRKGILVIKKNHQDIIETQYQEAA